MPGWGVALGVAGVVVVLVALDRAVARGWFDGVHLTVRSHRAGGAVTGGGFLGDLVEIFTPSHQHVTQEQERQRMDIVREGDAAPPDPEERPGRHPGPPATTNLRCRRVGASVPRAPAPPHGWEVVPSPGGHVALASVPAPPTPTRPRQAAATGSYHELSAQIREAGLLDRTPGFYFSLLAGLTTVLAGLVTAFVLLGHSWWQLLVAAGLGLVLTQFAFVAHEASHRQVLLTGPANDRLGRVLANGVVGISHSWWMTKHTRHHANPNRVGKDPDIEWDTISFLEEDAAKQRGFLAALTRRQGWLFFPLLTLEGVNLHVLAFKSLIASAPSRARTLELVILTARLGIYVALVLWALPIGMAAAFLAVQLAVFGVYMGASFAPNHKGMAIIPADSRLDFLSKQVLTSRNIGGGRFVTQLMGGLDAQIEHHLFPSMPRPHLARARRMVREHCATVGMPYTETSLARSYWLVVQYLNRVGLSARDPFDCPMVQRFRPRSTR